MILLMKVIFVIVVIQHMMVGSVFVKYYKPQYQHLPDDEHVPIYNKALQLMTSWNQHRIVDDDTIFRLNMPEMWTIDEKPCLIEPFIEGYQRFNSIK